MDAPQQRQLQLHSPVAQTHAPPGRAHAHAHAHGHTHAGGHMKSPDRTHAHSHSRSHSRSYPHSHLQSHSISPGAGAGAGALHPSLSPAIPQPARTHDTSADTDTAPHRLSAAQEVALAHAHVRAATSDPQSIEATSTTSPALVPAQAAPQAAPQPTPTPTPMLSRLKQSLVHRTPLSRTWDKASFAEECRSAPASLRGRGQEWGSFELAHREGEARVPVEDGMQGQGQELLRAQDDPAGAGERTSASGHQSFEAQPSATSTPHARAHAQAQAHLAPILFSPSGRPTSLYASPAALRAFRELPPGASELQAGAIPPVSEGYTRGAWARPQGAASVPTSPRGGVGSRSRDRS